MTVVSTIISQYCTVHASDSFLTVPENDGFHRVVESQRTKIVPVKHWRGAMAYYGGWAGPVETGGTKLNDKESTLKWLQKQSARARDFSSAEDFASYVAKQLNERIKKTYFDREISKGIGIHFSAYEYVQGYWIPELFHITNYLGTDYQTLRATGVQFTRETYCSIHSTDWSPEDRSDARRLEVKEYLQSEKMLIYNNGDPKMFNPIARAILQSLKEIPKGRLVRREDPDTYRKIASRVVKIVCDLQREFVVEGKTCYRRKTA